MKYVVERGKGKAVGPIVVPGMSVTVYFPPNFVGLKMSDDTVAIARTALAFGSYAHWWTKTYSSQLEKIPSMIDELQRPAKGTKSYQWLTEVIVPSLEERYSLRLVIRT